MIKRLKNWVPAGLLVLVLWHANVHAQQEAWERQIEASDAAYQQGNYGEAIKQGEAALIAAQAFGPDNFRVANTLNNLASIYKSRGNYRQAEPLYLRALAIDEKVLGPEHPDMADKLANLAELYRTHGKYAEAERSINGRR